MKVKESYAQCEKYIINDALSKDAFPFMVNVCALAEHRFSYIRMLFYAHNF